MSGKVPSNPGLYVSEPPRFPHLGHHISVRVRVSLSLSMPSLFLSVFSDYPHILRVSSRTCEGTAPVLDFGMKEKQTRCSSRANENGGTMFGWPQSLTKYMGGERGNRDGRGYRRDGLGGGLSASGRCMKE